MAYRGGETPKILLSLSVERRTLVNGDLARAIQVQESAAIQ